MNKGTNRSCWASLALVSTAGLLSACASPQVGHDVVVERPSVQGPVAVSADQLFDAADHDGNGYLTPLDVEPLGLGGNWHTLDLNGDGHLSRQEFRAQFATPLVQSTLTLPNDLRTTQPVVDDSYRLPPEPASERYHPAPSDAPTPATISVPDNAPIEVPLLIDDDAAAGDGMSDGEGTASGSAN
ncbi:EF-hand domain-containing protein [Salinicola endophyticus]|uniref:EF-hand domain-containing protein n=1 Tax=Salinicola endophyticus TaxID=1949083 RepID=A0AB74UFA7_9GAMM